MIDYCYGQVENNRDFQLPHKVVPVAPPPWRAPSIFFSDFLHPKFENDKKEKLAVAGMDSFVFDPHIFFY